MAIIMQRKTDYQIIFNERIYYGTYFFWKKIDTLNKRVNSLLSAINKETDKKTYDYNMNLVVSLNRQISMIFASGLWQGDIVPMGIYLARKKTLPKTAI